MGGNKIDSDTDGCCFQRRNPQEGSVDSLCGGDLSNNNRQFQKEGTMTTFAKKARVDLSFENVRYSVKEWTLRNPIPVRKEILKGVNGLFPSGELTAIMGPSGAGKSTLLNVLAAFTVRGATGRVMLNEVERDPVKFKKQSCYIQQDDFVRNELTVYEAMRYASDLKLSNSLAMKKREQQILEILNMLGLEFSGNTKTGSLSGGQRKRLSIALELISNPPVLFLDEPTTGLDSSSCTHCVSLLKFLAQQGRTVICTIHQPSSIVFNMIDNLYTLSEGNCLYSGKVNALVPYLGSLNLHCPQYHSPADFLLDIAIGEFGADLIKLKETADLEINKSLEAHRARNKEIEYKAAGGENNNDSNHDVDFVDKVKRPSFLSQTCILLKRKILMTYRRPTNMLLRMFSHLVISVLFGYLYYDTGPSAETVLANYVYIYGSSLFCVYTGLMSATLMFPLEMFIVSREHFNRWYNLGPYYLSMMIVEVPFQIACCLFYLPLSYYLTGQPMVLDRIAIFCFAVTILSLISQAMGFLIGIVTSRKIAVFIGPVLACLFSVFGFCLKYSDTPFVFRWLYFFSYFRAGFHLSVYAIYGKDRGDLYCPDKEVYCMFQDPKRFLKEMDSREIYFEPNSIYATSCLIVLHILTLLVIWYRLNRK